MKLRRKSLAKLKRRWSKAKWLRHLHKNIDIINIKCYTTESKGGDLDEKKKL